MRVGPVELGERHNTRTNWEALHRSRLPADQSGISVWQAGRGSRPTRRQSREDPREESFRGS